MHVFNCKLTAMTAPTPMAVGTTPGRPAVPGASACLDSHVSPPATAAVRTRHKMSLPSMIANRQGGMAPANGGALTEQQALLCHSQQRL